jgi:hypothetical protein
MRPRTIGASTVLIITVAAAANAQAPTGPAPAPRIVTQPGGVPAAAATQADTPRDADGHPILAGLWNGPNPATPPNVARNSPGFIDFLGRGGSFEGFEEDGGLLYHDYPNLPVYKPEFWNEVAENDYWGNWRDAGINFCMPNGLPRLRAPQLIKKFEGEPVLMIAYGGMFQTANYWRLVPTDGRPHNATRVAAETYMGDPVGRWESDTLVIESTGFTDNTWLLKNGYMHGFKMKVTERLTRKGNALVWEATVEDPEYLAQPFEMPPMTVYLNTNPTAVLAEALPCDSRIQEPWGTENNPAVGASHTRSGDDQLVPPAGHDFSGYSFPRDTSWYVK